MPPDENPVVAFTDGACSGNPGPGGWGAVVLFPDGTGNMDLDPERMTVRTRTLMPCGNIWQAVGGLYLENSENIHV